MSGKITSKNLSYDQTLPPFLARLRGEQASGSRSPDPILAARRRPGRIRSASEEAEDAPVVVDDEGNVVDIQPGELGAESEDGREQEGRKDDDDDDEKDRKQGTKPATERTAGIGAAKKRKMGRVVGGREDEDDDFNKEDRLDAGIAEAVRATNAIVKGAAKGDPKPAGKGARKGGTKKAKKIKLSFGDDEG